ncbi:tRNA (34-2'-O)-methyltransferase regulator WDR6 [Hetaerina americana]|uniref:tRNA (34-2'-O)-methyltransferase regulator WDR6 n=1 Tax=Hetaerina americana TaxID=62018 RepID=UPI003A7F1C38
MHLSHLFSNVESMVILEKMETCFSMSDAAAVKLSGHVILAGIGRSVYVFSIQRKTLLSKREVLSRQKIRELSVNSVNKVLVYGGKEAGIFKFTESGLEAEITDVSTWKSDDWIVHSRWLVCDEVATLSAHNVVTIWNNGGIKKFQIKCHDQSILYSGYLFGDKCDDLICFAGTVFGQVAVWSVNTKHADMICGTLHYLRGHKGAIYSIRYDPVSNLICTTSDDRSVRWWHKSSPLVQQNENSGSLHESWSAALIHPVSAGYGHLSRVWKCFVSPSFTFTVGEDSQLCVWKNLEIKQVFKGVDCEQSEFPLIARKQILHGGSIRNVDFSLTDGLVALGLGDGGILVWTLDSLVSPAHITSDSPLGSSDPSRRVCLYGKELEPIVITKSGTGLIKRRLDDEVSKWQNVCEKKYLGLCLLESSFDRKSIALTSSDGSLDILSGSHLAEGDGVSQCDGAIKYLDGVTLDGDYILSIHWLADDLLLTCRSRGQLQLWLMVQGDDFPTLKEVRTWVLPHSKQCWTTAAAWVPWGEPPGLILCGNRSGDLLIYSKDSPNPIQILKNLHGQMGVTSLMVFWPTYSQDKNWKPTYHEIYFQQPQQSRVNVSGHLFSAEIYSTGRDGIVNVFVLRNGLLKLKGSEKLGFEWAARFLVLNKNILVFGFKGANAVIWGIKERCIMLEKNCGGGHRSWDIDFVSQSDGSLDLILAMVTNGELTTVNWKLPSGTPGGSVVQGGLHSREINCISCFSPSKYLCNTSNDMTFVITGSEDTTAKVSSFSYNSSEKTPLFSTISTLHGHLSSIRAISILPIFPSDTLYECKNLALKENASRNAVTIEANDEHLDFMVFSAGGRAQLKAWKLSFDQIEKHFGVHPSQQLCRAEEKFSLMLDYKKRDSKNIENNLEARFMDVQSFYAKGRTPEKSQDMILVAVVTACSDGLLRLFGYRESQCHPERVEQKPYLGLWSHGIPHPTISKRHCLFKVLHSSFAGHDIVITTDLIGYYHLWDITSELESMEMSSVLLDTKHFEQRDKEPFFPFFSKLTHKFSINAVDWKEQSWLAVEDLQNNDDRSQVPPCMLVATGGEDGTLSLDLLAFLGNSKCEGWNKAVVQTSWKLEGAAATQIAGVKFVLDNYLVTVSKCQQVILWRWCYESKSSSLNASIISCCYSTIPDIEDIAVINTRDGVLVVVGGCGLEVLKIVVDNEEIK